MFDMAFFGIFPYLAVVMAVVFGIYRYQRNRFSYSSLSSQFLESSSLFWGSVTWHYAIILVLLSHLFVVFFPNFWARLVSEPARLYLLEMLGLALGILTVFGIVVLLIRRLANPRITMLTSLWDWALTAALLLQVLTGVYIAIAYRWGSFWAVEVAVPWLWSLVSFNPKLQYLTTIPFMMKLHFFLAFLLVLLFPFTKLAHLVTFPLEYLVRPWQVVVWYRKSGKK